MQFDTSGTVTYFNRASHHTDSVQWSGLSPFVHGYAEAMLVSLGDVFPKEDVRTAYLRFSDLAPETLARIMEDCANFSEAAHVSSAYAGKLFWKDRNWIAHLGVSLPFDNRYGDVLRTSPPLTVYLGDDGKVRFQ